MTPAYHMAKATSNRSTGLLFTAIDFFVSPYYIQGSSDPQFHQKEVEMAKAPLKYQLTNPGKIKTDETDLDFPAAQSMADEKVKSLCPDPMLISWFNATTGESHPKVDCGRTGKPGWLNYAQSLNCDMTVDINDEQFVFIYLTQP